MNFDPSYGSLTTIYIRMSGLNYRLQDEANLSQPETQTEEISPKLLKIFKEIQNNLCVFIIGLKAMCLCHHRPVASFISFFPFSYSNYFIFILRVSFCFYMPFLRLNGGAYLSLSVIFLWRRFPYLGTRRFPLILCAKNYRSYSDAYLTYAEFMHTK